MRPAQDNSLRAPILHPAALRYSHDHESSRRVNGTTAVLQRVPTPTRLPALPWRLRGSARRPAPPAGEPVHAREVSIEEFRPLNSPSRTSSNFSTGTTPLIPTFVIVPRAGMQARVANAVADLASVLVGSSKGVGKEGTKACEWRRSARRRRDGGKRRTAQHPTTRPYICTPASASATDAAVTPLCGERWSARRGQGDRQSPRRTQRCPRRYRQTQG